MPPTNVYGVVPSPQQFVGDNTTCVTIENSNSIKSEPKSRLETKQIIISINNPSTPSFVANTTLLHLPIPCFVMKGNILVFQIYHVHSTRKVQLANVALQGNILDSHFYVSHKSYKEVLGYVDVVIKKEHNCSSYYHDACNFGHFTSSKAIEQSSSF
jgi:hypothetical protein